MSAHRLDRERRTVTLMIELYCRGLHRAASLCQECLALKSYAMQRLERCPFQESKPSCLKCPVHCYRPEMREKIRVVMRYAGPRMLFRHPLLTIFHFLDERRKTCPRNAGKAS